MPFGDRAPRSFGRAPEPPAEPPAEPVMHLGEIRAELVLVPTIDPAAMLALGQQIAQVVAQATRAGFDAGMAQAMAGAEGLVPDDDADLVDAAGQTRAAGGLGLSSTPED